MGFSRDIPGRSGYGGRRLRRHAGGLVCALMMVALLGPVSGAAAANSQKPGALESLIAALGAARAERAVGAIGRGFPLMEAQKRIAATERKLAREGAEDPEPSPAVTEEVKDPSEMMPASAGTNGTTV